MGIEVGDVGVQGDRDPVVDEPSLAAGHLLELGEDALGQEMVMEIDDKSVFNNISSFGRDAIVVDSRSARKASSRGLGGLGMWGPRFVRGVVNAR
jgi:hypothetical protein